MSGLWFESSAVCCNSVSNFSGWLLLAYLNKAQLGMRGGKKRGEGEPIVDQKKNDGCQVKKVRKSPKQKHVKGRGKTCSILCRVGFSPNRPVDPS